MEIVFGVFLGLAYLIGVPLLALIALSRSSRNEEELRRLKSALKDAQQRIAQLATAAPPASPTSAVPRAEGVTPPAASPAMPVAAREAPAQVRTPAPVPANTSAPTAVTPAPSPAPIPKPVVPAKPAVQDTTPGPLSGLISWALAGNPLAKLGVLLLFFGLAYLFKYTAERDLLPIELRLAGAGLLAISLLGVGWRLRGKAALFGLILQGGAIGALYLTSFAAFRFYDLLPQPFVFALLIVICAASVVLAVLQRAQSLAVLASLGGYLAPVLLSTGGGSHVALFSYYGLLSIGILAVSLWQAWRPLNLVGFLFTFGVATAWGLRSYVPAHYATSQFFLAANLIVFGVLALLFAHRHQGEGKRFVDGTLVFGTPLVGFGLQYGITQHWQYGPAFSALGFAAFYLPLALFIVRRWPQEGQRLAVSFLALGGGFATLAIPLALSAKWTALAWALEGLGVLWVGCLQDERKMRWSGTALLVLAALSAAIAWEHGVDRVTFFLLTATLALTWMTAAWLWQRRELKADTPHPFALPLWLGGILSWLLLLVDGAQRLADLGAWPGERMAMLMLAGAMLSALVWHSIGRRLRWGLLQHACWLLWPLAALALLQQWEAGEHALAAGVWVGVWFPAIAVALRLLWRNDAALHRHASTALHASLMTGLTLLFGSELIWQLDQLGWGMQEWRHGGLMAGAALGLLVLQQLERRCAWPVRAHPVAWWMIGAVPLLLVLLMLLVGSNTLDGRLPSRPYVPLINPLEQGALFALLMLSVWCVRAGELFGKRAGLAALMVIAVLAAWWANGLLLRTLAQLGEVSWRAEALWDSRLIQTSFALAWTLAALACMRWATTHARRVVWIAGAVLLGIVIVKLFLVDAARGGGLARAVAFIGVALLVLLIGYVAPLPPKRKQVADAIATAAP